MATEMKWAAEQRYQFLELTAFWHGGLNRSDLMDRFGISVPQASKDLAAYQQMFPANLTYDASRKRYFTTENFVPKFVSLDSEQYLRTAASSSEMRGEALNHLIAEFLPVPMRTIAPSALQPVVECTRNGGSVEILYQSMNPNKPDPVWRRVSPHSFGNDGFRWHVRAFCHVDHKFKDFIVSRILEARDIGDSGAFVVDDVHWANVFDIKLVPNPLLSESQKSAIALEYRMSDGGMKISVRRAMLYYFAKRLRLDAAQALDSPHESPLVVSNRADFDAALAEAMI